jgi:hypothetical protein
MTKENHEDKVDYRNPPKDTRWKTGQSGNPKGRPKNTVYLSEMLRDQLDQVPDAIDGEPNTKTWRDLICDSILRAAVRGNQPALTKELLDRIEGKVTDKNKIESEMPVTIRFVPAKQVLEGKSEDDKG